MWKNKETLKPLVQSNPSVLKPPPPQKKKKKKKKRQDYCIEFCKLSTLLLIKLEYFFTPIYGIILTMIYS